MRAAMFLRLLVLLAAPVTSVSSPARAAAPLPALSASPAAGAAPEPADPRRGIVVVEKEGKPAAFGVVLANDGRVLTALSGLGGAEAVEVRFADGSVAKAKLGHKDTSWDLALLVPQSGKWPDGLRAGAADPAATELRTFMPGRPKPQVVHAKVKGHLDASPLKKSEGDAALDGAFPNPLEALDVEVRGAPVVGAPIVDREGTVLGVLVRACRSSGTAVADGGALHALVPVDAKPCTPGVVGAPVSALRAFLIRTPAAAAPPAPFLGIVATPDASGPMRGVKITAVAPGGPADKGGLKPQQDLVIAIEGAPVDSPDKVSELVGRHAVGDVVKLLVFGEGKIREVAITLRAAP